MLRITIKDLDKGELIYDNDVSMVIMQAVEKDGIRAIRHKTEDASVSDTFRCVKSAVDEAAEAKQILFNVFAESIDEINLDDLDE